MRDEDHAVHLSVRQTTIRGLSVVVEVDGRLAVKRVGGGHRRAAMKMGAGSTNGLDRNRTIEICAVVTTTSRTPLHDHTHAPTPSFRVERDGWLGSTERSRRLTS